MKNNIIFAGCSFTWGQGLWSYCPTDLKVPTESEYTRDNYPIPDVAQVFREANRFANLARHWDSDAIIKRNNGGTDEESIRFIDEVKQNNVKNDGLLTQNVNWENVKLCVFQTTQLYRSSFYFNYKGNDYRVFSEPNKRNFDRVEKIKFIFNPDGSPARYPLVLNENESTDIFIDWLIDNNYSVEDFEKIHCNYMTNKIKNKLKELEEKYNIPTLLLCWTDEYLMNFLKDDWLSKRLIKINYFGTNFNTIEEMFFSNKEFEIRNDPNVLHESGNDGHPSLECHRHIASSIINKIEKDNLIKK